MAIFGAKKKLAPVLESALRAKSRGRDYIKIVDTALASIPTELSDDDHRALASLKFLRSEYLWDNGEKQKALTNLLQVFEGVYVDEDWSALVADWIRADNITDIKYRILLEKRLEIAPEDRRSSLSLARMIAELPNPTEEDIDIVERAVKEFPLWKGGSSVLTIRYLAHERTDAEALEVYKFAYPHNKNNEKLIEYLTRALIANQDRSEFAIKFYRDRIESGADVPEALGMLCDSYLEKGDISPTTWPFIADALARGMLSPHGVKHVSDFILTNQKEYFNRRKLAEEVYEKGYRGQELVQYLADEYAADLEVNEKTIPVFVDAFKAHALSKKSIRVLTDHYLHAGDRGEFAARVYETYLSMVPELPQPKLYEYLAENYVRLGRTDEQAKKIYEEALQSDPDDTELIRMLAQTYLSYGVTSLEAIRVYKRAYKEHIDDYTKHSIALVLAEANIKIKRFDEETLEYLRMLKGAYPAPLEKQFNEALVYCYMNLDRRDSEAQAQYGKLYKSLSNPPSKLVHILASITIETRKDGKPFDKDEIALFDHVFELEKFSCDPEIAFVLVEHRLKNKEERLKVVTPAVRVFESDVHRLARILESQNASDIFVDIGDFYAGRFNFEMASVAYREAVKYTGLDSAKYRLSKMLINEGNAEGALESLSTLSIPDAKSEAQLYYWRGVCYLVLNDPVEALKCFERIKETEKLNEFIPSFLLDLRMGQALEQAGKWQKARIKYRAVLENPEAKNFHRWADIEIAVLYIKEKRFKDALQQAEDMYNKNRTGRAESRYFAMALLYNGFKALEKNDIEITTSLWSQAVQVDMGDRLLRDVITDLLLIEGEKAFFSKNYDRSRMFFETSLAVLPKRLDTRWYLAYSYHELRDYNQALIQYTNVPWDQAPADLQRSQGYAYLSSGRHEKAWRVFLDLIRKNQFDDSDIPLLFSSYLSDTLWSGSRIFKDLQFKDDSIDYANFYIHDGQYDRAINLLNKLGEKPEYKEDFSILWFLGLANEKLGNREMAVHHWREILKRSDRPDIDKSKRMQEYLEIGLAFMDSGYTDEAMKTWESLEQIDSQFEHLAKLKAETLSLSAYQSVRKAEKVKIAINYWKKALEFDQRNYKLVQNLAIAYWQVEDFTNSARYWNRMIDWWKKALEKNPKHFAIFSIYISEIQRVLTDLISSKGRADHDLMKVRTEDIIDYYQKANRFYWLLNLDKRATVNDVERAYFRLVKIYNPERHADTFMLLEEAYANLTDVNKKEKIDLFAYNPLDIEVLREIVWGGKKHVNVFGALRAKIVPPLPKHSWLQPTKLDREIVLSQMSERLKMNLKLPDWNLV